MNELLVLFLQGLALNCLIMAATWAFSVKVNNYGIVDAVWSLSFSVNALFFACQTEGWISRQVLITVLVAIWSLRLGLFLAHRIYSHHPKEDVRYKDLRKDYGSNMKTRFFWFFQIQAWSVSLLTIPFLLINANQTPYLKTVEVLGAALWLIALLGETLADHQKSKFRKNPANEGKISEVGLWRYSRHPNYFFESLIWWAYFLIALAAPWGWTSFFAPVIMLWLLVKVTGVPLAEKNSLKAYGDSFRDYQRRVSVFLPWFRKA